jgi:hypothetical protein
MEKRDGSGFLGRAACSAPMTLFAVQGRDGGIALFQPNTRADEDNFTCFGGRRWGAYLRRNIRTYSSMSREVLSALRITHVLKHNDASERGFTTTPAV